MGVTLQSVVLPFGLLAFASLDPVTVEAWLAAGGYLLLFGVLCLCGLGLPLPEDVPLIAAGALIATGKMHWLGACVVAWSGIMIGDLLLYHIGKRFGRNVSMIPVVGRHINQDRLDKVEKWFEKYGIWVVAIGRMFAGVRGAMVLTAGTIRYSLVKFIIADGIAAIVSGGLFVLLGYWLGQNLPELMRRVERGKLVFLGIVVVAGLIWGTWWWLRRQQRRRMVLAAAAKSAD